MSVGFFMTLLSLTIVNISNPNTGQLRPRGAEDTGRHRRRLSA
jgi:hypothetical protein